MKVEIFSFCDFAQSDSSGKLSLIGVIDSIFASELPVIYGLCSLAIRVRFNKAEVGLKNFRISFTDPYGKPAMPPMETPIQVQIAENGSHAIVQLVSLFAQLTFPNFGEYSIELAIDGSLVASTPLFVRQSQVIPPDRLKQ